MKLLVGEIKNRRRQDETVEEVGGPEVTHDVALFSDFLKLLINHTIS